MAMGALTQEATHRQREGQAALDKNWDRKMLIVISNVDKDGWLHDRDRGRLVFGGGSEDTAAWSRTSC